MKNWQFSVPWFKFPLYFWTSVHITKHKKMKFTEWIYSPLFCSLLHTLKSCSWWLGTGTLESGWLVGSGGCSLRRNWQKSASSLLHKCFHKWSKNFCKSNVGGGMWGASCLFLLLAATPSSTLSFWGDILKRKGERSIAWFSSLHCS